MHTIHFTSLTLTREVTPGGGDGDQLFTLHEEWISNMHVSHTEFWCECMTKKDTPTLLLTSVLFKKKLIDLLRKQGSNHIDHNRLDYPLP